MTRTELQQRIYDIDAAIEYKIREITELLNERRQLQDRLASAETFDMDAVIEMAEDDIRRLFNTIDLTADISPISRRVTVYRRSWSYPDVQYSTKTVVAVDDGDPIEIALATALRLAAGLPIPEEYRPYLKYTYCEG